MKLHEEDRSKSEVMSAMVRKTFLLIIAFLFFSCEPQPNYRLAIDKLVNLIEWELEDKELNGISIVLVDDQNIVWSAGFGYANREKKISARKNTIYRVASVSKLFTSIAVMQLAEQGEVDIDNPVSQYLSDSELGSKIGNSITLRQLMSHRSGIVREPPKGNYFDPSESTIEETVASLRETPIIYEPGKRTKYSNAGMAIAGLVVQKLRKKPFAQTIYESILQPAGMKQSSFVLTKGLEEKLAKGTMWRYDGKIFDAPLFEFGMSPAANLYTSMQDMGHFMTALFQNQEEDGPFLKKKNLHAMYEIQYPTEGSNSGFGLGFYISELEGKKKISHSGVVYGHATRFAALPDQKLGVCVVTNTDVANAVTDRIADYALQLMLSQKLSQPMPAMTFTNPIDHEKTRGLMGVYEGSTKRLELVEQNGRLFADFGLGPIELRILGDTLFTEGKLEVGQKLQIYGYKLISGADTLVRREKEKPHPIPDRWKGLIGEYGFDHNILYVLEKQGRLYALIEWIEYDPLEEISNDVYAFPPYQMYHGEKLIFKRDVNGLATEVVAASMVFKRRPTGIQPESFFRIEPVLPIEEIIKKIRDNKMPKEHGDFRDPDLVDLSKLDPNIKFDIRYATDNNFLGTPVYSTPAAYLQRPAADALLRAQHKLEEYGYGLMVFDGYRPWQVSKIFWEATPAELRIFVADPSKGSRHNRGCAIDITLYDLKTGNPVEMVSEYDEFTDRSFAYYPGGTSFQRWHRDLLIRIMQEEGFTVYPWEWWHFDFSAWKEYPLMNISFDQLEQKMKVNININ